VDPDKKNKDWILMYLRAMYSEWLKGGSHLVRDRHNQIILNRQYAEGKQDPNKYKGYFDPEKNPSFISMNWDVVSPIPKIVSIIRGRFMARGEYMSANAVDPISVDAATQARSMMEAKMLLRDELATLDAIIGQQMEPNEGWQPETPEELEIFFRTNYKQNEEVFAEVGMAILSDDSDWEKSVKDQLIYDSIVDGFMAVRDFRDNNSYIKSERLDILDCIVGYSKKRDFTDIPHAGVVRGMTINQLKMAAGDQFTETEYKDIAEGVMGKYGNPSSYEADFSAGLNTGFYDSLIVEVLDGAFLSTNRMTYQKRPVDNGSRMALFKEPLGTQAKEGREVFTADIEVYYKGCWLIGTDYMYNHGLGEDMRRRKLPNGKICSKANLPFHFYRVSLKSAVEKMSPYGDQFQLHYLKLQNTAAQARPSGLAIELEGLEGITVDGKEWSPLKVITMFNQTGNMIYRRDSRPGANGKPFESLTNGLTAEAMQWTQMMNWAVEQMRQVSGLNEVTDATTPDPSQPVATSQMAAASSTYALNHLYDGYISIKERAFRAMLNRLQLAVKNGDYYGFAEAMGYNRLKMVKVSPNISMREFGIRIEAKPGDQEKAIFNARIQAAIDKGDINVEDSFVLEQIMEVSLHYAKQLFALRRDKKMKMMAQIAQQQQQGNGEVQMKSAAAASQNKIQEKGAEAEGKLKLQTEKHTQDLELAEKAHEYRMAEIREENLAKALLAVQQPETQPA
jgi:hypothetical protein